MLGSRPGQALPARRELEKAAGALPARLPRHRLAHPDLRPRLDWRDWLAGLGEAPPEGAKRLTINDHTLVVQAVLEGQGLALGRRHLTDRLVRAGLLARVFPHVMRTGQHFRVVWAKDRPLSECARLVRDWLIETGERERRERV